MLFRQLEYFVAVARERHFARAAEACFVSQPALSTAIAKLERELNVMLINRGHNFEGLTPEGERLVVWAKRILAEHDTFKTEVAAMRSGITGTLRLGTEPTVSTVTGLPVAAFCATHPLARVKVCAGLSAAELRRRLRDFEVDAAIALVAPDEREGLEVMPLYRERYVLIVSGEQLVPGGDPIGWAEAAQLPLALLTPDLKFRQLIDAAFARTGLAPTPQVEADSLATLYALVATGSWVGVVPQTWLRTMPMTAGMRALPLVDPEAGAGLGAGSGAAPGLEPEPAGREEISLAINAGRPGSVLARAFLRAAVGLALDERLGAQGRDLARARQAA
jgi:DNA-binding transcriptional LysR family regulator